jgi:hypothetical protein
MMTREKHAEVCGGSLMKLEPRVPAIGRWLRYWLCLFCNEEIVTVED